MSKPAKILRRADVERLTGLPRSTLYDRIAKGTFPKPIKLSVRSVGWLEADIAAWQQSHIDQRDASTAEATPPESPIKTGRDSDQFPLRLPDGARNQIRKAASANGRSMNAEIVARLITPSPSDGLRDRFAGQALFGLSVGVTAYDAFVYRTKAEFAYKLADAMLAERDKGGAS